MIKQTLFVFCLLCSLAACKKDSHNVTRSFCFWKTDLYFDEKSDTLAKTLKLKHFYVRYFDVDWNPYAKEAQPVASIKEINFGKTQTPFTPSVFITNDVVLKSSKIQLDTLARRISAKINQITNQYITERATNDANAIADANYEKQKGEAKKRIDVLELVAEKKIELKKNTTDILIDCDWTEKTKANYFYLLEKIKTAFPNYKIEATIRLWQYKYYTKAGIPPVQKGLLMCYNMNNLQDKQTQNSIGTANDLKQYLTHNSYPLPLNVALPLYSWSVVFRGAQFKGVLSDEVDFSQDSITFKKTAANTYTLQNDIRIADFYLRNGDEIRIEKVTDDQLQEMIDLACDKLNITNQTRVTFFSFDKKYITDYGTSNISKYFSQF